MKKITMIAVVAMFAGAAAADLSVEWRSQAGGVTDTTGSPDFLVGSTIQLLWSDTSVITTDGEYNLNAMEAANGFYVLASSTTGANSLWTEGGDVYTSADIGNADINTGFFYTRIFQTDGSVGDYFLDIPMAAGADYVYVAALPTTVFKDNVVSGVQNINANNTTVVPEPATIGLFGLGALSAWIIRRNKLKAREEV